jgi:hypothetical protein
MAVAAEASVSHCVAPADLIRLDQPLRRTARRLASHKLIMIVALGSSSTAGAGASSAETTYPSQLMVELTQRFQTQPITVLNRGISGEQSILDPVQCLTPSTTTMSVGSGRCGSNR